MALKPKALLIQPPVYDFALYDLFYKPLGLLRIGSWLKRSGWDVEYLNCLDYTDKITTEILGKPKRKKNGTGKFHRQPAQKPQALQGIRRAYARYGILSDVIREQLVSGEAGNTGGPDAVFITTGMTYWYPGVVEAVATVRDVYRNVPIFAGGIYATLMPGHLHINSDVDYVITGEALSLQTRHLSQLDPKRSGLAKDSAGQDMQSILSGLGFPADAEPSIYPDEDASKIYGEAGIIELNRGCPFTCTYCASSLICSSFVPGDAEAAYSHFQELWRRGIRNFAFYDDALLYKKEKVLHPFLQAVVSAGGIPKFYTPNAVHLRYIDFETAMLMKQAGFQEVRLGFESAQEGFHSTYDNKLSLADFKERVGALKKAGFRSGELRVYVLAGLPGQYAGAVEQSVRYAHEAGVRVMLARYSPVPGTALWKQSIALSRYPIDEEPLFHNNTFFSMEWEGFTRADLQCLQDLTVELNDKVE